MRLTTTHPVTVTAAAGDMPGTRTIAGLLVPYGPIGHTNVGPLTVQAGAIRLPEDLSRIKLLYEHSDRPGSVPVGHLVSAESRSDGLYGVFRIGTTAAADAAMQEAAERLRDGFSVELMNITAGASRGEVAGADLTATALVATPAFGDARVFDVAASLVATEDPAAPDPDDPDQSDDDPDADTAGDDSPQEGTDMNASTTTPPAPVTASAPAGLPAGNAGGRITAVRSMSDVYAAMAAVNTGQRTPEVTAALTDITYSANIAVMPPAYVGELWDGVAYQRRIVPLLNSDTLTSMRVNGWRWVVRPEVADYAGDKADVPSNPATTEAVDTDAARLAGAHDIDRAWRDFGNTEYFAAYYAAMTESYAKQSDQRAAAAILAAATASTVPAGSDLLDMIVAGALAMPEDDAPTFVLISRDLLPQAFTLTRDTVPALLALSLGLDGTGQVDNVQLRATSALPAGTVVVGARQAMTWYELPGSPIRVEAVDLVKGGVDAGVFGYYATIANNAAALRRVTVAA